MTVNEDKVKETIPIIVAAEDIIREAVKIHPDLPHDKAVQQWFSENHPEYEEMFKKHYEKYADRISIGDIAVHYAITELIEKVFKYGGKKCSRYVTRNYFLLLWSIMFFSLIGSFILLINGKFYGLVSLISVSVAFIAFMLAIDRGLIGIKR